jgi:chitinase
MKRFITKQLYLALSALAGLLLVFSCNTQAPKAKQHRVIGYVAGYRNFDFTKIDAKKLTHINYAFANVINGEVMFDTTNIDNTSLKTDDLKALFALKEQNPDLKILVSVGGWVWSGNFSDAALTNEAREKFAHSAAQFVKEYQLDGIDIDWEYPNQSGAGNIHRVEDIENFTLLMKAVREALDALGKPDNTHYLLTIATGADEAFIENTRLGEAQKYLDFINIMTYDFYNGWHSTTGHHSNLHPSANPNLDKNNVLNAVDLHLGAGVPASKLNLGIPFYGRKWIGVKSKQNNGLFQDAESVGHIEFYHQIAPVINQDGYTRYWDEQAQVPYLWNPDSAIFISYEDSVSIALKVQYLKDKGLSGVMFWEYSDDYQGELLDVLYNELEGK